MDTQSKINAAVSKLHSEIANAKAREPIANHEANKAKLITLFKAESEKKGWQEVYGKEVLDRCLAAFEKACDDQRYVAVCAAYAKHGAFSVGATLNILLDVLDY